MTGRVHSIQSMGTLDGPGVRYVIFLQGCHLRCGCCHNPDTWDMAAGDVYEASSLVARAVRFREYFGEKGGVTLSGGEPLLQPDFARAIFAGCHEAGIHTCLDTSGAVPPDAVDAVLACTDRVLLDIKYTSDALYRRHVGCGLDAPLKFLARLQALHIPVTLRQVIIPGLNDTAENIRALSAIAAAHDCVDGVELLPFRKICQVKYDRMGMAFPFGDREVPSRERMRELEGML